MLIGAWDRTIELSKRIADEFKRFTAGNPNITLSAGIGTYKPHVPIATSSVQTGEILDKSKSGGRNRLTIFQTTLAWEDFASVEDWARKLTQGLEGESRISKGFLYRLLE